MRLFCCSLGSIFPPGCCTEAESELRVAVLLQVGPGLRGVTATASAGRFVVRHPPPPTRPCFCRPSHTNAWTRRCCPRTPLPPSLQLFQPLHLYGRANQWRTRVYCLLPAWAADAPPPLLKCFSFLPISAFTYHFPGDIELPMPRPPRHIFELAQLLFIPTNNLVMKY